MNLYSLNPTLQQVNDYITWCKRTQNALTVVVGEARYAKAIAHELPDMLVVWRPHAQDYGYKDIRPDEFIYRHIDNMQYDNMILHPPANEVHGYVNMRGLDQWQAEFANFCLLEGIKCVLWNGSVGTPAVGDEHLLDESFELACTHPGQVWWGVHEYANFSNRTSWGGRWHMGRFRQWLDYADSQTYPMPRILITEWGADRVEPGALAPHELQVSGPDLVNLYNEAWSHFYTKEGLGRHADYDDLTWAVDGVAPFCLWGHGSEKWGPFDHNTLAGFMENFQPFKTFKKAIPMKTMYYVNQSNTLIRERPSTSARTVAVLKFGMRVKVNLDQNYQASGDGYVWTRVKTEDGFEGWAAMWSQDMFQDNAPTLGDVEDLEERIQELENKLAEAAKTVRETRDEAIEVLRLRLNALIDDMEDTS